MPSNPGIILKECEPHQPYLLVPPCILEECRREFPGVLVRPFEQASCEADALTRQPRNRHERRTDKKVNKNVPSS